MSRKATAADIPHILDLAKTFHDEVSPDWPWDRAAFEAALLNCIDSHFVRVSDRGFFMGMLAPYPLSPAWVQAHELFMWSQDGSAPENMRAFRKWAKLKGAHSIEWSCRPKNKRVQRFFQKIATPTMLGFTEVL